MFSVFTVISLTSELAALMEGVGRHHWLSVSICYGVFELMLKTILLGEMARRSYSSNASIYIEVGASGCESMLSSWQEEMRSPAIIIMYV